MVTGSRYLKAGYYKVALSYGNNAYDPTSGNAVAFNITMDRDPIHAGKYEGNSTMKREFSPSPKIKLWTIEKESTVTCEESKEVEVEMERPEPVIDEANDDFKTNPKNPNIYVTACKGEANNVWRLRVHQVTAGTEIEIHTGGYRDALLNPPVNEKEAVEAVVFMNSYQESGRVLGWHIMAAAMAHENHHRREFEDAFKFYWKYLAIQDELEKQSVSCDEYPEMDQALAAMSPVVTKWRTILDLEATDYVKRLPDGPNDRPYCAGQAVLNRATLQIIEQAMLNGWNDVPTDITQPGTIEPPCFLPPVSEGKTRSMAIAEGASFLILSIADTSRFSEGRITVRFRNEGSLPVRIPDEINDKTVDFFFLTVLRTEKGDIRILNSEKGKMTFLRPLNYRELVPGQEYSITIPLCLDEVDLAGWKQCSCELETRYYNQQGKDCFLGTLRATAKLAL